MSTAGVVIVGAGQAAAVAAQALRDHGYGGRITMVGREMWRPYERPPLSKAVLTDADEPALDVITEEKWTRNEVELLAGREAVALDLAQRQVQLATGEVIGYEKCLLATGGEPRTLESFPRGAAHVHYVRTIEDARRLRAVLRERPRVAVIGGGFLGLEVAHSALSMGACVTVIERAPVLLDRFLPLEASAWVEATLRAAGARLLLEASVAQVHASRSGRLLLITEDGTLMEVEEVVVAVGMSPNDTLARAAGLSTAPGGGVWVDAKCRTSNEHVYASGDCASQIRTSRARPVRLESWQNANEQARTAAAAMAGASVPLAAVPWFWTDQGPHNVQMLGLPQDGLEYVRRGEPASSRVLWFGHRDGVPVHGVAINAGTDLRALRPLFEREQPVPLQLFAETPNLRAWVKQSMSDALASH